MLLQFDSISKRFPGVQALSDVSFSVDASEVVAVVGENGAGKSTLLKILSGIHSPDDGRVLVDGVSYDRLTVRQSMDLGIQLIHQELNLADNLNIAENVFLGDQPYRGARWLRITHRQEMYRQTSDLLNRVGLPLTPTTRVGRLSVGQQQQVEIAKALSRQARVLVLDEPTSSLSLAEAERLLTLLEELKRQSVAIIYVSHRLSEVKRIADRVVVLRDGQHVGTLSGDNEMKDNTMISLMVGRELSRLFPDKNPPSAGAKPALQVSGLQNATIHRPISFRIAQGEIVGFAGLVGAGRTELAHVLFGVDAHSGGQIQIGQQAIAVQSPRQAVKAGIALVPEDRKRHGLVPDFPIRDNLTFVTLPRLARFGWRSRVQENESSQMSAERFGVRTPNLFRKVKYLSGGNQQKTVLAKWLAAAPELLILDEPTRGVDVGAKKEIYELIVKLAHRGVGIMLISSEMEEILGLSHRVLVMHDNAIQGELTGDQMNDEIIMSLAIGSKVDNL